MKSLGIIALWGDRKFMVDASNLIQKISINILLLAAVFFVYKVISEMILVQNDTERSVELMNLETKEQCRQWVEENKEIILNMPQYSIDCNRGSWEANNNYRPRTKKSKSKRK
jgi:hypothetical protein